LARRAPPGRIIMVLLLAPFASMLIGAYTAFMSITSQLANVPMNTTVGGPYLAYMSELVSTLYTLLTNPWFVAGLISLGLVLGVVRRG